MLSKRIKIRNTYKYRYLTLYCYFKTLNSDIRYVMKEPKEPRTIELSIVIIIAVGSTKPVLIKSTVEPIITGIEEIKPENAPRIHNFNSPL